MPSLGTVIVLVVAFSVLIWPYVAAWIVYLATPPGERHDDLARASSTITLIFVGWLVTAGILIALPFLI